MQLRSGRHLREQEGERASGACTWRDETRNAESGSVNNSTAREVELEGRRQDGRSLSVITKRRAGTPPVIGVAAPWCAP
jgi:hypothetical protein